MTRLLQVLGFGLGVCVAFLSANRADASQICKHMVFDGHGYVICTVQAEQAPQLRLWHEGPDGQALRHFSNLRRLLPPGQVLVFAMNAGMFHPDYKPVGLLVIEAQKKAPLVLDASQGNFGLLPNGVFCVDGSGPFHVVESRRFARSRPECRLASQSGPMLVIDGKLHPRFLVDATSRYVRNGVGVSSDQQTAWFAISDRPVTFHEFGRLFRDGLGAQNALYFDGSVSRLYAPSVNRADFGRSLGPIIGLIEAES